MKHPPGNLAFFVRDSFALFGAILVCAALAVWAFFGCSGSQEMTIAQAQAGLRLACDGLAVAMSRGSDVSPPVLATVCDAEKTSRLMREVMLEARRIEIIESTEWLDQTVSSPPPASDAGGAK